MFCDSHLKWRLNILKNKKDTFELGGFIPLLQGEETEKGLRNYPEFGGEKVKIRFVCGINTDNLLEVFFEFRSEAGSGRIDLDPLVENVTDPLHMYRLMKLVDKFPLLDKGNRLFAGTFSRSKAYVRGLYQNHI